MRHRSFLPLLLVGLLIGSLVALGCDGDPTGPTAQRITELPRQLTTAERDVIGASNTFAFGLLGEVRAVQPDSPNTFLSPLSASMALGMTMNGAAGDTWTQMHDALGFAGMEEQAINEAYRSLIELLLELDPAVTFGLGNSIWTNRIPLLDGFVDRVETYFDAVIRDLDFSDPTGKETMNQWVDSVTNGRLKTLIKQIPPDAVMYQINASYFQADWRQPFDEDRTAPTTFTRADGSRVTVPMMAGEIGYRTLNAGSSDAVQGVELPYGGAYAAVAMLPPEDQPIDEFVAGVDAATWTGWMQHFDEAAASEDTDREGLMVRMPRFELEWGASLIPALEALGMTDAFNGQLADFGRMAEGGENFYIFEVKQKTFVKVDEKGTEAAAATSVGVGVTSAPPSITLDRPFLFAIRERFSGTILFMGVIGDPSV